MSLAISTKIVILWIISAAPEASLCLRSILQKPLQRRTVLSARISDTVDARSYSRRVNILEQLNLRRQGLKRRISMPDISMHFWYFRQK